MIALAPFLRPLGLALGILAVLGLAYWRGHATASSACRADELRVEAAHHKAVAEKMAADLAEARRQLVTFAADAAARERETETIVKEIEAHVPPAPACALGPDVTRLLNRARRGAVQPAP